VDGLHRRPDRCRQLIEALRTDDRVTEVNANPRTGTVLLRFPRDESIDGMLAWLGACAERWLPASRTEAPGRAPAAAGGTQRRETRAGRTHEQPPSIAWHVHELRSVFRQLQSRPSGLSREEAHERRRRYGPNRLPDPAGRSGLAMLAGQVFNLPVGLLGISAVVSVATGGVVDAFVIGGVVLTNTAIGFFTERQAERVIASLGSYVPRDATVIRSARSQQVAVEDIVPGDVVHLRPGTHVPADLRLFKARHLSIDESALTGESVPVAKHARVLAREDLPLADRVNMIYMGTRVTGGGQGLAIVVATGAATEIGRIQTRG
jgi:P-type Ca2+ transporter type 2C